jgi:ribosomal protein S18 acetylase RimI-like enzyme
MSGIAFTALRVRDLCEEDLADVVRIDAAHTGNRIPDYWDRVFGDFLGPERRRPGIALAAEDAGELVGYLLGEVRAFEFGSEPCGWVFAAGVDPRHLRSGVASRMLVECCRRFREQGIGRVRTMVRRNDIPVLTFFRSNGFTMGSFVQLELDLEESP